MNETQIIEQFYEAFDSLDAERMVSFYHPKITFEDPAFGTLHGEHAKNMWRMLCASQKDKDFTVVASNIEYKDMYCKARWDAYYTFSLTRRKVHNIIYAHFTFREGKIIKHVDTFNFYKWSKQAMGFKGFLLGWTPFFQKKVTQTAIRQLAKFEATKNSN